MGRPLSQRKEEGCLARLHRMPEREALDSSGSLQRSSRRKQGVYSVRHQRHLRAGVSLAVITRRHQRRRAGYLDSQDRSLAAYLDRRPSLRSHRLGSLVLLSLLSKGEFSANRPHNLLSSPVACSVLASPRLNHNKPRNPLFSARQLKTIWVLVPAPHCKHPHQPSDRNQKSTLRVGSWRFNALGTRTTQSAALRCVVDHIYLHPAHALQYFFYNVVEPGTTSRYGRPAGATDETKWAKAVRENPDPESRVV